MNWHVVCRVGDDDVYDPQLGPGVPRFDISLEQEGSPKRMRHNVDATLTSVIGRHPNDTVRDLLYAAMAVQSGDLYVGREQGSDSWSRDVEVHLPVVDVQLWEKARPAIEETLAFLSGDVWRFRFRERKLSRETRREPGSSSEDTPEAVCLFSGGLDSLVGAVDLLADGRRLACVGHYAAGATHAFQTALAAELKKEFRNAMHALFFYVDPPEIGVTNREKSRRARSFLFMALALSVAAAIGTHVPVYICENGLISLNVPLTGARAGSCSTRTTHPHFVALLRRTLGDLGISNPLVLPYRFKTKGEMLKEAQRSETLKRLVPATMSCAHPESGRWEGASPNTHCGYCYPCIIRRAAVGAAGMTDAEYVFDVVTHDFPADSQKALDSRAVRIALERRKYRPASHALFDVLNTGPLEPADARQYADVYRRGLDELEELLSGGNSA